MLNKELIDFLKNMPPEYDLVFKDEKTGAVFELFSLEREDKTEKIYLKGAPL